MLAESRKLIPEYHQLSAGGRALRVRMQEKAEELLERFHGSQECLSSFKEQFTPDLAPGNMSFMEEGENCEVTLTPLQVYYLLETLCVDLGFCLPPKDNARLEEKPPTDVESFTTAVFIAEQMDPFANSRLRELVREVVQGAFTRAASRENRR